VLTELVDPTLKVMAEQQAILQVKQQTGGVYNAFGDFMKR